MEDGRIAGIASGTQGDRKVDVLAPGLIDNHNHGGFGCSVMTSGEREYAGWLEDLARHGVTATLAGVYTAPMEVMRSAIAVAQRVMAFQQAGIIGGARLLGVHLEGPFLSREKPGSGAMDVHELLTPTVEAYDCLVEQTGDVIKEITIAPETPGCDSLIAYLKSKGIRMLAGHTNATYDDGQRAFRQGVGAVCHFFNASRGIHHREPGILASALLDDRIFCEAICDFVHVHPAALQVLIGMKGRDRVMIISDAVTMAGFPDCEYMDGPDHIIQRDGACRLDNGDLAGGAAYVTDGVRKLVSLGIPLEDALTMASATPAQWLGLTDCGGITENRRADLTALNDDLSTAFTLVGGVPYDPAS